MKKYVMQFSLIAVILVQSASAQWEILFNGKNLDGWKQLNGKAEFKVKDGIIIGSSVVGEPNSFLATTKNYGNFILELEFWTDATMNAGVQIRSESTADFQNGRVHGYQIEIDPSERAWSAGVYDEARRGWLYDLRLNPLAQQAFIANDWNKLHIEAIGSSIRTWLNGVPAANLVDEMTPTDFIALQVHQSSESGLKIRYRNIKIIDLGTATAFPAQIQTK